MKIVLWLLLACASISAQTYQQLLISQKISSGTAITLGNSTIGISVGDCDTSLGGSAGSPINTTGASLLIIAVGGFANVTMTDLIGGSASGNTIVPLTQQQDGIGVRSQLFYIQNPNVGANHTIFSSGGSLEWCSLVAFNNVKTSSVFDQETGNTASAATTIKPGAITATSGFLHITAATSYNADVAPTVDSGFTVIQSTGGGGSSFGGGIAWKLATGSSLDPQWSESGGALFGASTAATFAKP